NHPGTGPPSNDRAGSPRRSPGTPHQCGTAARYPARTSPRAHTPTPAPPPACPRHTPPSPPRPSYAGHETPTCPDALPPPESPATPGDPPAATPAYPAGTRTADHDPPDGPPSPYPDPVKPGQGTHANTPRFCNSPKAH